MFAVDLGGIMSLLAKTSSQAPGCGNTGSVNSTVRLEVIDRKAIAATIRAEIKLEVAKLKASSGFALCGCFVQLL